MSRVYEEFDPGYAATCSDVTLCSNTKGFFKNFAEDLVAIAESNNWLQEFEKVEDGKKVAAVKENKEVCVIIIAEKVAKRLTVLEEE
jgi:hypothetical protein